MTNDFFEIGTKPIPPRIPLKFDRDDYETPISEKFIAALEEYFHVTRGEIYRRGETPDAVIFDELFTPEVIKDPNAIKKIYASTPYFAFRNTIYYINRETDAFSNFWKIIKDRPGSVLDHGGGGGTFLEVLLRMGITDLTYTDIPGPTFEFVKWFFGDKVKYEEDPDNIKGYYDYITSNSVLEHIPDPIKTVNMFADHLKPGGKIIASMANDIHGQHLKESIDRYSEVIGLVTEINKKSEDYLATQLSGSAWTTKDPHYQQMVKEGVEWMVESMADKPMSILDLGCGDAWSTEEIRRQLTAPDIKIVGGDIDTNKLDDAKKRGVQVEYQDMHNVTGKWDAIFCSHTLEHSHDFKKALSSIINALNPNGSLYLIVPIEPNDPRQYNPSHTQWIDTSSKIRNEILSHTDVEIFYENVCSRDTQEYWVRIRKKI
jgi:2-polyprenyl-3-methyl-5-hydroxy-6-metoxy-1,4-benzoquinol methylase